MANLTQLQTRISARFDQVGGTISETSGEWTRRTTLINDAARKWAKITRWVQLLTTTTLTTTASQNYVDLPSGAEYGNLILPSDQMIKLNNLYYSLVPYDVAKSKDDSDYYMYILGDPINGYKLYINPTPSDAYSFDLAYYTTELATDSSGTSQEELTTGTDITKCPDPDYLVYGTLMELFLIDGDDQFNKYEQMQLDVLNNMLENNLLGQVNEGFGIVEVDVAQNFSPIGGLDF